MSLLYAIYAFVIGVVDLLGGWRLIQEEDNWQKIVGISAILIGVIAFIAGFQAILGFYVDPLFMLLPLVGAGFIIMVDSWKQYKETGSLSGLFIAIYNTFAWIINLIQLIMLLERRRE